MKTGIRRFWFSFCILHFAFCILSCNKPANEVTLYTSVDQPIAAPIIKDFETRTGIHVNLVTDAEATKSVGLAERLRAEKDHPQCDVYWGNEPFLTINLAEEGLLAPYESPSAKDVPEQFKDPQHRWVSNGLRARIIIIKVRPPFGIEHLEELTKPELKGAIAMARPTAGTTGGHVAALYVLWGDEKAKAFFRGLHANEIKLLGGNSVVAESVAQQKFAAGLTDNDDAIAANREVGPVIRSLPDQDSFGTLMIPTTVGLVSGAAHSENAKKLIDFVLSAEVEKKLLKADFAGWSVRELDKTNVKSMQVDYREVAKVMPRAVREATAILEGREP